MPLATWAAPAWGSSSPEVTGGSWMAWTPPGQGGGGAWADEPTAICVPGSSECGTQGLSPGGVWPVADCRACPGPRTSGSPCVGHESAPQPEGRCPQCGGLWCWAPTRVPPGLGVAITCMLGEAVTGFGESRAKGRTPGTVWRGLLHFLCERKSRVTHPPTVDLELGGGGPSVQGRVRGERQVLVHPLGDSLTSTFWAPPEAVRGWRSPLTGQLAH